MPLHPVILPPEAALLHQVVGLQQILLTALCGSAAQPADITVAWLQAVWPAQDAGWVEKFCRDGTQESILPPLRVIAGLGPDLKHSLLAAFAAQTDMAMVFAAGGQFADSQSLPGLTLDQRKALKELGGLFYGRLGHEKKRGWMGYCFTTPAGPAHLTKHSYAEAFLKTNREKVSPLFVCPFCDGQQDDTPPLDHYYPKGQYIFHTCCPENLVPICTNCNKSQVKGTTPPLTPDLANPAADWLHPFFRCAPVDCCVELTGIPPEPLPKLVSPSAWHQPALDNHAKLISLQTRWQTRAIQYFAGLRTKYMQTRWGSNLPALAASEREDQYSKRGIEEFSLVKVAVCQALLDDKLGYRLAITESSLQVVG